MAAATRRQETSTHYVTVKGFKGDARRPVATLEPKAGASSLLVLLHGLGDTAGGWIDTAAGFLGPKLPGTRIVLPTAPTRPITMNGGFPMPGWYDIESLAKSRELERCRGIEDSMAEILQIVNEHTHSTTDGEAASGSTTTVPRSRVVLAGFSQGGGLSLFTALQAEEAFAGTLVLSGYLPALELVKPKLSDAGRRTPVHFCHGENDPLVVPAMFEDAKRHVEGWREGFEGAGAVSSRTYAGMEHEASMEELRDALEVLQGWLKPAAETAASAPTPAPGKGKDSASKSAAV